jgi:hypothetical protein
MVMRVLQNSSTLYDEALAKIGGLTGILQLLLRGVLA